MYAITQLVRGPVEPGMRMMKLNGMFQRRYRGSWENMQMFYKVAVHLRAVDMYEQSEFGFPFHRGYGPFLHFQ
jgi:hypothetical protein